MQAVVKDLSGEKKVEKFVESIVLELIREDLAKKTSHQRGEKFEKLLESAK